MAPPTGSAATALDGNAVAGDLGDVFAFDVTVATTRCATCHHTHAIATLRAYMRAPGLVLCCASCGAVQIKLVRAPGRAWLDLSGVEVLEVPRDAT
jgi:hypothetical protein